MFIRPIMGGSSGGGVVGDPFEGMHYTDGSRYFWEYNSMSFTRQTVICEIQVSETAPGVAAFFVINQSVGGPSGSYVRMLSSDSGNAGKMYCQVFDIFSTEVCRVVSKSRVDDGNPHIVVFQWNSIDGFEKLVIDGEDENDTANPLYIAMPVTVNMSTGTYRTYLGNDNGALGNSLVGKMGYVMISDWWNVDPFDFMDGPNQVVIDTVGWSQFGTVQPAIFKLDGDFLSGNDGSSALANFATIGTITGPDLLF